uniref:Uncharacterized protein n=1 Tax=Heterorhabditis bacteriophora TaxID=37862 RepID=A0A1I7XBH3_HETBA
MEFLNVCSGFNYLSLRLIPNCCGKTTVIFLFFTNKGSYTLVTYSVHAFIFRKFLHRLQLALHDITLQILVHWTLTVGFYFYVLGNVSYPEEYLHNAVVEDTRSTINRFQLVNNNYSRAIAKKDLIEKKQTVTDKIISRISQEEVLFQIQENPTPRDSKNPTVQAIYDQNTSGSSV